MPRPLRPRRYADPASARAGATGRTLGLLLTGLAAAGCTATGGGSDPAGTGGTPPAASDGPAGTAPAAAPGEGTAYCQAVGGGLAELFATIQGPQDVDRAMGRVRTVLREAPPAVADEWQRLGAAAGDVEDGLTDLARLRSRADAGEITRRQLRRRSQDVLARLAAFDTPRNGRAADRVTRHAERYCGVRPAP